MTAAALDQLVELADVTVDAFGLCEVGQDYSLRCDPHGSAVVHFVLKGEGSFLSDRDRFHLAPGAVIVVPESLRHSLRGTGPIKHFRDTNRACALADGLMSFRAFDGAADLVLGSAVLSATLGAKLPLFAHLQEPIVEHCEDEGLLALFPLMLRELSSADLGTRASVSAKMKQIVMGLLKSPKSSRFSLLLPTMNTRIGDVVAAVLSRPQDDYTLDKLTASASMSLTRFRYHFSKACSCQPQEFVIAVRNANAARLLRESDLQVQEIAASLGSSYTALGREFRASYGLAPSEFRRTSTPLTAGKAPPPPSVRDSQ